MSDNVKHRMAVTPVDGNKVWWAHVKKVIAHLEREFPGVLDFTTYLSHGIYDGEKGAASAVDIRVSPWCESAKGSERELLMRLKSWMDKNWRAGRIDYAIVSGEINNFDGRGWVHYDHRPYQRRFGGCTVTHTHDDHAHITFLEPPQTVGDLSGGSL